MGTWLEDRLKELGKNQAGLARALGLPQQRIREINKGLRRIQQTEWEPLANFLEWSIPEVHRAFSDMQIGHIAVYDTRDAKVSAPKVKLTPLDQMGGLLPVYWNRAGGNGVLNIERRKVEEIPRGQDLKFSFYSFGIEVMQDDMSPCFDRRDVAVMNPDRPVVPGDDVLLVRGYEEKSSAPFDGMLRRLVKETDTHWVVKQFNPAKEYKLAKSDWPRALYVAWRKSR